MQRFPLEGLRAVEFSQWVAASQAGAWLAVMGAEVIKIESGLRPDPWRFGDGSGAGLTGVDQSAAWVQVNLGKKGITLDMKKPRAVELVKQLVKVSDIVLENYGAGVIERWGLGYTELRKINSSIIMISCSGWGRTGPRKDHVCYAPLVDAFIGLDFMNGYAGGKSQMLGTSGWADMVASHHLTFGLLCALYHRMRTGQGQYIDYSMCEGSANFIGEAIMDYTMNGGVHGPTGNRHEFMAPHGCYRCKGDDKWIAIAVSNQSEWVAFCEAIDSPEWTERKEFGDELSRWNNQEELNKLVEQWTRARDHYEIMQKLQRVGVMAGASIDEVEALKDPHFDARDYIVEMEHPEIGKLRLVSFPWKLSDSGKGNYRRAPLLGEHNDHVFGELLGLSTDEIARLKEEGVIR